MKVQDADRLAEVLAQCPALAHLDLSSNYNFGAAGAERLAGVLGAGAPQSQLRLDRSSRSREASSFVAWSSLRPSFVCSTLHCLLVALCCSRHARKNSDILCTYIVVAFGLSLSL
jgi:anti-sigma factor RsiW